MAKVYIDLAVNDEGRSSNYKGWEFFVTATHRYGVFKHAIHERSGMKTWVMFKIPLNPPGCTVYIDGVADLELFKLAHPVGS